MRNPIADVFAKCRQQLDRAHLLAVSKQQSVENIKILYDLGQRRFGENYVQEAVDKIAQLPKDIEWHYIGQLQANKTKLIVENFSWVQTVDRIKVATRLDAHCHLVNKVLQVCIYINIDDEPQKGGVVADKLDELIKHIQRCPNLKLRGLMVLPKQQDDYQQQLTSFQRVRKIFDELNHRGMGLDVLSMGTSDDYQAAIKSGSTMVRIGRALFGERS